MTNTLRVFLLFMALFFINLIVLTGLSKLGFRILLNEVSSLIPPLYSTLTLIMVEKRLKKRKEEFDEAKK